jgi:hypothetical protein
MKLSLSMAIRRVVLLALAPVPMSCGGAIATDNGSSPSPAEGGPVDDANATLDHDEPADVSTGRRDGEPVYPDSALPDVHVPLDGATRPDAEGPDAGRPDAARPDAAPFDAAFDVAVDAVTPSDAGCQLYEDGGTGPCAPYWIVGSGCSGGEVYFPCGLPEPADSSTPCAPYCMGSPVFNSCHLVTDSGYGDPPFDVDAATGPVTVACYQLVTGRRPAILVDEPSPAAHTIGEVLARCAYLEEASVGAFLELARQLEAHGAPESLVRRLRQAAGEEVGHARTMTALSRAYGSEPPIVHTEDCGHRSLLAIAVDNAREGCVRETWGAACALVQSMCASDPRVRAAMRYIAEDELSHATLSWDVARWIEAHLSPDERARVDQERARAIAELESDVAQPQPEPWRAALGWPTPDEARAILRGMRSQVWTNAA